MLISVFVITLIAVSVKSGKPSGSLVAGIKARNSTQINDTPKICGSQLRCCKLGHKAANRAYTCHFEAFIQALEQHRSYSHRLKSGRTPDRMVAVKAFKRTSRLMSRLGRCRSSKHKKCFQLCCKKKSKDMKKRGKSGRQQKL